ncbi:MULTISPECIES: MoxR family ATPase [Paracoccus]|uniref:AAA domain-containing protein n=1 Tax=Paracoccus litorisediminis TaxID=2006130 RepID=A0A844HMG1_9RHOB|nr:MULTISPECIES: AAA family ATPase [Paracoccus]MBD9529836.1 AAA family ATPase [Paracoccus sp. PAR01]MTH60269.1 AAA domain-containing protein [Paracoccus litorisediminis]
MTQLEPITADPVTRLAADVASGLVGHERLVERLVIALLAGGHVLLEGPPGIAKTRAVKRLAAHLPGSHARIQCTPDLLPSDLTGTQVYRAESGSFDFVPGPVFHTLVLVDEINRAPPKVQSALLEAMAEGQVTSGGITRPLPDPFMVVATQNPIEHEGTFPLPEAQMDRFLLHLSLDMPDAETERGILDLVEAELAAPPTARALPIALDQIHAAREAVARVHLAPALKDFIVRLVMATRPGGAVAQWVEHPVSPRGTLALAAAVRARAWLQGRDHGLPEDVEALTQDALAHRLIPNWQALSEGRTGRSLIADVLREVRPW